MPKIPLYRFIDFKQTNHEPRKRENKRWSAVKLRDVKNLPVFCQKNRCFVARIDHAVIDEAFHLRYLVVKKSNGEEAWIAAEAFTLTEERAEIEEPTCMKIGLDGQNLSIYEKNCGRRVHDEKGGQVGRVTDFLLDPSQKCVVALEVSRGYLEDFLYGRLHVPLTAVYFDHSFYAAIQPEGGERSCFAQFAGGLKSES